LQCVKQCSVKIQILLKTGRDPRLKIHWKAPNRLRFSQTKRVFFFRAISLKKMLAESCTRPKTFFECGGLREGGGSERLCFVIFWVLLRVILVIGRFGLPQGEIFLIASQKQQFFFLKHLK